MRGVGGGDGLIQGVRVGEGGFWELAEDIEKKYICILRYSVQTKVVQILMPLPFAYFFKRLDGKGGGGGGQKGGERG